MKNHRISVVEKMWNSFSGRLLSVVNKITTHYPYPHKQIMIKIKKIHHINNTVFSFPQNPQGISNKNFVLV